MATSRENLYTLAAVGVVVVSAVFRLLYAGVIPLVPDEAYYWQWSRYPALGYHDHGPLIAWTIAACTRPFGHTEAAVRLPSVLSILGASLYIIALTRRYTRPGTDFHLAVMMQTILLFQVGGILAVPDGLLALGWAGAAYHVARGYENGTPRHWLLGGMWFGFGMLTKYSMALFPPFALAYGLLYNRKRLLRPAPWLGVATGLLLFSPVIIWNAANGFRTFRHVAYMGGVGEASFLRLRFIGDFLGGQAAILSPLVFLLIAAAWGTAAPTPQRRAIESYLRWISLSVFLFFTALAFHTRVYANWPATAYIAVSVMAAERFSPASRPFPNDPLRRFGRRLWRPAVWLSAFMTAVVLVHAATNLLPLPARLNRTAGELSGWTAIGEAAAGLLQKMPDPETTHLYAFTYQEASELAFYTPGRPKTVSINRWGRPNAYDDWWNDSELRGTDGIVLAKNRTTSEKHILRVFRRTDPPVPVDIRPWSIFGSKNATPIRRMYLYKAYHFTGGLSYQPAGDGDVRLPR